MSKLDNDSVRVTPLELFTGDLKKIQPHLDIEGACFQLQYNGKKVSLQLGYEVWTGGKIVDSNYFDVKIEKPFKGELSISLKENIYSDVKPSTLSLKIVLSKKSGISSARYLIQKGDVRVTQVQAIEEKTDRIDEPFYLWGYLGSNSFIPQQDDECLESLALQLDWSILIKLDLKDNSEV